MLSSKAQYACLAMLQLAQEHAAAQPVQAPRIAERHGIPPTFLVQILHELKCAGLVASTRGAAGGYRLSRPPGDITLADVVDVFESTEEPLDCAAPHSPLASVMRDVCCELVRARREQLQAATLSELADRAAAGAGAMWVI
ncbi:MAG TPA: Rrf2 family transcriptional regulator [Lacipirellulaceae bacterium]|nr:Rrf2 family transcriptional regulator [Lacipirellulaceae bacterium]